MRIVTLALVAAGAYFGSRLYGRIKASRRPADPSADPFAEPSAPAGEGAAPAQAGAAGNPPMPGRDGAQPRRTQASGSAVGLPSAEVMHRSDPVVAGSGGAGGTGSAASHGNALDVLEQHPRGNYGMTESDAVEPTIADRGAAGGGGKKTGFPGIDST